MEEYPSRRHRKPGVKDNIAVLQLVYRETTDLKWLFPQEKAALHDLGDFTRIGEPL
jgi:hypothetical protein